MKRLFALSCLFFLPVACQAGTPFWEFYGDRSIMAEGVRDQVYLRFRAVPVEGESAQWVVGPLTASDVGSVFLADLTAGEWPRLSDYLTNDRLDYTFSIGVSFLPDMYDDDDRAIFRKPLAFVRPDTGIELAEWQLYALEIATVMLDGALYTQAHVAHELRLSVVPGPPTAVSAGILFLNCLVWRPLKSFGSRFRRPVAQST